MRKSIPLLDLKRQYKEMQGEIDAAVLAALGATSYIMGENVRAFEQEFAAYIGVKYAVAVGNGTDALVIALKALGIGRGDEVITSPFTFFATAESISAVGAVPVFVDVRPDTYNINEDLIEAAVTERTKAVLPISIFGQCPDFDRINAVAKKHGLAVLEDAAQSAGARYKDRRSGALSDLATFSFFPTKNLSCAGDGGMITTDSEELAVICRALRTHGSGENGAKALAYLEGGNFSEGPEETADNTVYNPAKYYNYLVGHNSRLDELQAAILRVKLKRLDTYVDNRRAHAHFYTEALGDTAGLTVPAEAADGYHAYHQYVLQADDRKRVVERLEAAGVAVGVYYPVPLHMQKAYTRDPAMAARFPYGSLPVAEYLAERTFAIPVFPELTGEERAYIAEALNDTD